MSSKKTQWVVEAVDSPNISHILSSPPPITRHTSSSYFYQSNEMSMSGKTESIKSNHSQKNSVGRFRNTNVNFTPHSPQSPLVSSSLLSPLSPGNRGLLGSLGFRSRNVVSTVPTLLTPLDQLCMDGSEGSEQRDGINHKNNDDSNRQEHYVCSSPRLNNHFATPIGKTRLAANLMKLLDDNLDRFFAICYYIYIA